MAGPSVAVRFFADLTGLSKGIDEVATKSAGAGSKVAAGWGAVAGVVSGAAITAFGASSVKAAEESAVANARLEQVFASMGDTTGTAAKAAENYAGVLSRKIGVDDEAIQAGQAQLATFGNVSSETARLAGVFDRATAAGADLAAAGFGTIDSNAVQLGKALQDPTQGLTALARSGVTFTDQQKDQIKAMQDSGDLLGAQNLVLKAVETQVGGTGEATATSSAKMKVAFGEVQEQIGGKLMPIVSGAMDLFAKYADVIVPLAGAIAGLVLAVKGYQLAQELASAATAAWSVIQTVFNIIMAANPIVLVIIAIVALVAAVILAYEKVGWFRAFVDAAMAGIVTAFNWVKDAAEAVFNWVSDNWPLLLAILLGPIGIAATLIIKNFNTIRDAISTVVDWVRDNWQLLLAIITGPIGVATYLITSNFDTIKSAITGVYDWVKDKFGAIGDIVSGVSDKIAGFAGSVVGAFKTPINAFIDAWNGIQFTVPGIHVPGTNVDLGGFTVGTPDIPRLARGGTVLSTGLALVHEGEMFSGVGGGFGTVINVNVATTGLGADAPEIQRAVVNALRAHTARNGPLDVPVRAAS